MSSAGGFGSDFIIIIGMKDSLCLEFLFVEKKKKKKKIKKIKKKKNCLKVTLQDSFLFFLSKFWVPLLL